MFLDINECYTLANNCSLLAKCEDTVGGFNCTCRSGFSGDGYTCTSK